MNIPAVSFLALSLRDPLSHPLHGVKGAIVGVEPLRVESSQDLVDVLRAVL